MSDNEKDSLWNNFVSDIVPLNKKNQRQYSHNHKKPHKSKEREFEVRSNDQHYNRSNEVDRNTEKRLKRGQTPIEGKLDLHGMTQNQAYDALLSFISNSYEAEKRCVLVITGKGGLKVGNPSMINNKVGILKQKVPVWLDSYPLNEYILKLKTARPKHGGEGALYVLLRKNRK